MDNTDIDEIVAPGAIAWFVYDAPCHSWRQTMEKAYTANLAIADAQRVRAAQYVRMSTEHQSYSIDNQKDAIGMFKHRQTNRTAD
ncbi:hypothetical protein [Mesorhizobium shangrilense]|uniref:Uncharacterized protein n=1 Tax=Mesorhizobium shangrilense TaxID=460060 RepID=A0ABV2DMP9_9HYPH